MRAIGVLVILSSVVPIALLLGGISTTESYQNEISERQIELEEPLPVSAGEVVEKSKEQIISHVANASEVDSDDGAMAEIDDVRNSNFISGWLVLERTWVGIHPGVPEPRAASTATPELIGRIPNLERAINIFEDNTAEWIETCKSAYQRDTPRECMTVREFPQAILVHISGDEFILIEDNLKPELRDQEIRNAGVMEDGLERRILLANGEVIVEQVKNFVEREPRAGEEIVPAQIMKEFVSVFLYEGIEYEARITVIQSLPPDHYLLVPETLIPEEIPSFRGATLLLRRASGSEIEYAARLVSEGALIQSSITDADLVDYPRFRNAFKEVHLKMLEWEIICRPGHLLFPHCPERTVLYLDLTEAEFNALIKLSNLDPAEPNRERILSPSGDTRKSYDSIIEFEGVQYIILIDSRWFTP